MYSQSLLLPITKKKLLKFGVCFLGINALLIGLDRSSAKAFTLDLFTDANVEVVSGVKRQRVTTEAFVNSFASDTDTNLSGTDLGQRTLELTVDEFSLDNASIQVISNTRVSPNQNTASISSNSGVTIDSAKFTWGSDSTTPQDITDGGTDDSLLIDILSIDLTTGADFAFTFEDSDGDTGSIIQNVSSTGNVYFPYETLTNNSPNVNQTAIREVSLEITNAPPDFDATFNFVQSAVQPQAVPFEFSPSLGLVLCGGLFGINKLQKKLKSN